MSEEENPKEASIEATKEKTGEPKKKKMKLKVKEKSDVKVGEAPEAFEPKIIAFLCNWCSYAGADLAGVSRYQYPTNTRTVRVMCSASVSPHHILLAFQQGVDGVFVGG